MTFHAGAQLVTVDLQTGEHRFHRPHALCGLGDPYMKFHATRHDQWRDPDRPGGACGMLSTYGTSPQQPRRLRSPNRIFAGENDAEGAHVRGPVSFVPPRESGLAAGRATQGVVATSGAFMSDEPTLGSSSSTPCSASNRATTASTVVDTSDTPKKKDPYKCEKGCNANNDTTITTEWWITKINPSSKYTESSKFFHWKANMTTDNL